ncbi:MAG: gliding motility-associated C-terminal domain-containing protein [Bacteroidota bacterium]
MKTKHHVILFCLSIASLNTFSQITLTTSSQGNTKCNGSGCNYTGPTILINEVMLYPDNGQDGSIYGTGLASPSPSEGEWIELYNPDQCNSIDISCYFLGNNTHVWAALSPMALGDYGGGYVIPPNTIVPPLGFVIVRGRNAPSVPSNLLVANGGKTVELVVGATGTCRDGGSRLWFPNDGGWFAFYDRNGAPQDAISWGNQTNLNLLPCVPTISGCSFSGTLPSYNNISSGRKTLIYGVAPMGQSLRRIPDGSAWQVGVPASPTYGTCNSACAVAPISTCNGQASVIVTGGTPPYSYLWNDGTSQATATAISLCAGNYTVTVTDGASATNSANVQVSNFVPTLTINPITNVLCNGICNGSATAILTSSATPFTYSWNTNPVQTLATAINLCAGNYAVTATDTNKCANTTTVTITQPLTALTVSITADNAVCSPLNGYAMANVSGGTPSYHYSWNTTPSQTTKNATNLPSGTYSLTVTDDNGCTASNTVTIANTSNPIANAGSDQTVCAGVKVTLTASGGTSYSWSGGVQNGVAFTPTATTTYTVTVTNSNGCTATDNVVVNVNPLPAVNAGLDKTVCAGTNVTLTASGGTSYSWSGGVQNGVAFTPVATTTYTVTTTNSCGTASDNVVITVASLPTANAGKDTTIFIRGNGNAYLHGSGGTIYLWTPGTNLSCTNCANPIANPLTTTSYILEVTDSNGCTDRDTVTVFVNTECGEIFVPSAFSPNGDGKNDYAVVHSPCIKTIDFSIYNRWGQKVFHTNKMITLDKSEGWNGKFNNNGKDMDPEVFYYVLKVELKNDPNVIKQSSGNITLVR